MKRTYKYYNPNPAGKETSDCVVRALQVVTGEDYKSIYEELFWIGLEKSVMPNDKEAYEQFLKDRGWKYLGVSNKRGTKRPTVEGFTKAHKSGRYFLRVANHVVGTRDGQYLDIWDSGECCLYGWWYKE